MYHNSCLLVILDQDLELTYYCGGQSITHDLILLVKVEGLRKLAHSQLWMSINLGCLGFLYHIMHYTKTLYSVNTNPGGIPHVAIPMFSFLFFHKPLAGCSDFHVNMSRMYHNVMAMICGSR